MSRLSELGLTLRNIDLGSLEAESDPRLSEYFVQTPYVADLIGNRRTLFLGRKGSGKSAVFTQLDHLLDAQGHAEAIIVRLTPDQYAWDTLRSYEEQGLMLDQAHSNAWKYTLALQAAAALVRDKLSLSTEEAREAVDVLGRFVGDNYKSAPPTLGTAAASLLAGLRKLNLSAFGFEFGMEREGAAEMPVTPAVATAMLEAIARVTSDVTLVVALDRLDDSWDGSERSHALLIGLLKAAREVNAGELAAGSEGTFRVLTFLRTDIYDGLKFDDKDKHRETERRIQWDEATLKEMLQARLPDGATVAQLFEEGDMRQRVAPFDYIARRTYLRPREVLQFVQLCIDSSPPEATEIAKSTVYEAETTYSAWKVEDLAQEYSRIYPELEDALDVLRQERHRYPSMSELAAVVERKRKVGAPTISSEQILDMLFETSAIGIRPNDSGSVRYRADDPRMARSWSGTVYVHPSLRKGLNITEARESTADE